MKKRIFALLLVACMAAGLLAGCGGSEQQNSQTTQSSQSGTTNTDVVPESITLRVWSPSEAQNPDLGQWLVTMCNQFNALHPEWDITFAAAAVIISIPIAALFLATQKYYSVGVTGAVKG